MDAASVCGMVAVVFLTGYLTVALLLPERFS